MTRRFAVAVGVGLLLAGLVPTASAQDTTQHDGAERQLTKAQDLAVAKAEKAKGPNPWLSLVPDPDELDHHGWGMKAHHESKLRAALRTAGPEAQLEAAWNRPAQPLLYSEREPAGTVGDNDTVATAERVRRFGTRPWRNNRAVVAGSLAVPGAPTPTPLPPGVEDDGSRPLATDTGIDGVGAVATTGEIGDGPHGAAGSGSGDFDFYRLEAGEGQEITARTNTPVGPLDTMLVIYDAAGQVAFNDDSAGSLDSAVSYVTPAAGTYWVMATGFFALPNDPDDSASGSGAASEGPYELTMAVRDTSPPTPLPPGTEDDGSRPLATDTGIDGVGAIETTGEIGDGPHGAAGSGSGDFDFYRLEVGPGAEISARTNTPVGDLDTMLAIYDADGLVAFNDDAGSLDSYVVHNADDPGTYWVMVTGFPVLPDDPDDSASGNGAASEGPYELTINVREADVDTFSFRLRKGDVLGVSSTGGVAQVGLLEPDGELVMGSAQNVSFAYSIDSPLPGGGDIVAEHVADQRGWHHVRVTGQGDYELQVEAYRPALQRNRPIQTLFLDFDGERINTGAIWGGRGNVDLSPFADFIEGWGLVSYDENALIDQITATVRENLKRDLRREGGNPRFRLRVTNSRDHADTFGDPHVSRVIVGGTIEESGIPTIGIAQSIDPGNFGMEESALVLLDVLSGDPSVFGDASLNAYIAPSSHVIRFVGTAIGNVVSHEAGHFFGDWHVDQFNDTLNLMDQGGNFPLLYGVGDDGIGGTADDPDVDFGEDTFNPNEGFSGTEDTLTRLSQVLRR